MQTANHVWRPLRGVSFLSLVMCGALLAPVASADPARSEQQGPLWIGIMLNHVSDADRERLGDKLPEGQGVMVMEVMPESPAAEADIAAGDVLLSVDGEPLKDPKQLMLLVREAEGTLKFRVLHEGKARTVKITPVERPMSGPFESWREMPRDGEQLKLWVDRMVRDGWGGQGQRILQFGPMPRGVEIQEAPLPPDVSVTIHKQGSQPAKIHVQRGDEEWNFTAEELDQLPVELRGPVGAMLGYRAINIEVGPRSIRERMRGEDEEKAVEETTAPATEAAEPAKEAQQPEAGSNLQRELQELQRKVDRQMRELQQQVEKLQRGLQENEPGKKRPARPQPE